jgi:transcription initiation factor IIF auxiliary subunit
MSNGNFGTVIDEPPFEIEEEGWGEFELAITLYFTDPTEKAVDLYHTLRVRSNYLQIGLCILYSVVTNIL